MTSPPSTVHRPQSVQSGRLWAWRLNRGLLTVVCGLCVTGCLYRSLTIKTDPPGAQVLVNSQPQGISPLTYDFEWYGWYRLTLLKEGFERVDDHRLIQSPGYLWIPCDLIAELLPFPVRDAHVWSYTLKPREELPLPQPPPLTTSKAAVPTASSAQPTPQANPATPTAEESAPQPAGASSNGAR